MQFYDKPIEKLSLFLCAIPHDEWLFGWVFHSRVIKKSWALFCSLVKLICLNSLAYILLLVNIEKQGALKFRKWKWKRGVYWPGFQKGAIKGKNLLQIIEKRRLKSSHSEVGVRPSIHFKMKKWRLFQFLNLKLRCWIYLSIPKIYPQSTSKLANIY